MAKKKEPKKKEAAEKKEVVIEKGVYCAYCAKTQDLENGVCPECGRPA